jgi:hypothetical protein
MIKYKVAILDANFFAFVGTPTGNEMFNGDEGTDGGGRILNCRELKKNRWDGYNIGDAFFGLLVTQNSAEETAITDAGISVVETFEDPVLFLNAYYPC